MTMKYSYSAGECWFMHPDACRRCDEPRPWAPGDSRWLMWTACNHWSWDPPDGHCECSCHEGQIIVAGDAA